MMDTLLRIFYGPVQPFIFHPERAYFMAKGFAILLGVAIRRSGKVKPRIHVFMMSAALLWVLFGLNEHQAIEKGWNIRVDILLFWPVLLVVSIASACFGIRGIVARKSRVRNASNTSEDTSLTDGPHRYR